MRDLLHGFFDILKAKIACNSIMKPTINIEYCPKCGWLLRSAWMAQELLTTFTDDLHAVQLTPSEVAGRYIISLNEEIVWDRKREGHFPEPKEIKQLVRDRIDPDRDLGHSDRKTL
ncbi:SelT/SelW/SelH family protein [Dyadobacter sp. CY327]|nr:SelT/SelW/SelH family protein [Dyadobacter sp. CY327]MCE7071596.1 SelT/SelW/SelH family protein [Dyadobacter sp. CY327]